MARRRVVELTGDWQAGCHVLIRQRKFELLGIVVVLFHVDELEGDESLVASCECFRTRVVGFSMDIPLVTKIGVAKGACCERCTSDNPWCSC